MTKEIHKHYKKQVTNNEITSIHNYKIENRTVDSRRVRSFHSIGPLEGNKNVLIGMLGAAHFVINMKCPEPRTIMKAGAYSTYKNPNFIWLYNKRTSGISDGYITQSGGYLINLQTNSYIKANIPPEEIGSEQMFKSGKYIIKFMGDKFEKIKKSEGASESHINYVEKTEFEGELNTRKPVTDMRELDHVKWDLFVDKIVEKVPYIKTKKQAKEWLNGDKDYGPPNQDMRNALSKHLEKDEFSKIKENL